MRMKRECMRILQVWARDIAGKMSGVSDVCLYLCLCIVVVLSDFHIIITVSFSRVWYSGFLVVEVQQATMIFSFWFLGFSSAQCLRYVKRLDGSNNQGSLWSLAVKVGKGAGASCCEYRLVARFSRTNLVTVLYRKAK